MNAENGPNNGGAYKQWATIIVGQIEKIESHQDDLSQRVRELEIKTAVLHTRLGLYVTIAAFAIAIAMEIIRHVMFK